MSETPDVLLTMTARFARVSWKYSGIAYALTLKHVGVVQQTLYLLTTALRIAGCAIGTGDTERSARAFGLDWREESAVGNSSSVRFRTRSAGKLSTGHERDCFPPNV